MNYNIQINERIVEELVKIGFSLKHKGTYFIAEAINLVYMSDDIEILDNLQENVYMQIAKKYKKNLENIKSNILKATNCMYLETDLEIIKEYFTFYENRKPTPKLIIITICNKLKKEESNNYIMN